MGSTFNADMAGIPALVPVYENPGIARLTYDTQNFSLIADDESDGAVIPIGPIGLVELGAKLILIGLRMQEDSHAL